MKENKTNEKCDDTYHIEIQMGHLDEAYEQRIRRKES